MQPKYIVKNEYTKETGQSITFTQGDAVSVTLLFFNSDGTPLIVPAGSTSEVVAKVFSQINQASIQKKMSLNQVTLVTCGQLGGTFGIQFVLSATDTASMAANNAGLPCSAVFTTNIGTLEYDFQALFNVLAPTVTT